jgi:hypothetical protein
VFESPRPDQSAARICGRRSGAELRMPPGGEAVDASGEAEAREQRPDGACKEPSQARGDAESGLPDEIGSARLWHHDCSPTSRSPPVPSSPVDDARPRFPNRVRGGAFGFQLLQAAAPQVEVAVLDTSMGSRPSCAFLRAVACVASSRHKRIPNW